MAAFKLTLAGIKAAGLKALDEGRMQIQSPTKPERGCMYRDPAGFCCVIGSALPDDLLPPSANWKGIGRVFTEHSTLVTYERGEWRKIQELQATHDQLILNTSNGRADLPVAEKVAIMRAALEAIPS